MQTGKRVRPGDGRAQDGVDGAAAEASLADDFLRALLHASGDCIKLLDGEGRILLINPAGVDLLGAQSAEQLVGQGWADMWAPAEAALAREAMAAAWKGEISRFSAFGRTLTGIERFWDVQVAPVRSGAGDIRYLLSTARDMTEQQRTRAQLELLTHELAHRVRNMLTMASAIAHQTLKPPATLAEAAETLSARFRAFADAQSLLLDSSSDGADIGAVVSRALAPHAGDDRDRFDIGGPPHRLSASQALMLALALHELATNAWKYGALASEGGRVRLHWEPAGETGLRLVWEEAGGKPVTPPSRRGFGSRLLERAFAAEFRARVRLDYAPAGLVCTLSPLESRASDQG